MNNCNNGGLISQLRGQVKAFLSIRSGFLILEALIGLLLFSILVHYTLSWINNMTQAQKNMKEEIHLLTYASSVLERLTVGNQISSHPNFHVSYAVYSIDQQSFQGDEIFHKPIPTAHYAVCSFHSNNNPATYFTCCSWIYTPKLGAS